LVTLNPITVMITHTLVGGVYLKQNRKTRGKTAKTCEKDPLGGCVYYFACLIGNESLTPETYRFTKINSGALQSIDFVLAQQYRPTYFS
jgi:hypothetical protein